MNTISNVVKEIDEFIKNSEQEILSLSQPLNTKKATEGEIAKTEEKLACNIPTELRDYFLNEVNGTETNVEKYPFEDGNLDFFSHQKIMGIYVFFKFYWEEIYQIEIPEMEIEEHLYEDEIAFIEKNKKEFFICVVNWSEKFLQTFAFDKEGNYYRFLFYHDEIMNDYIDTMYEYINNMISVDNRMKKDKSLIKLLKGYFKGVKVANREAKLIFKTK